MNRCPRALPCAFLILLLWACRSVAPTAAPAAGPGSATQASASAPAVAAGTLPAATAAPAAADAAAIGSLRNARVALDRKAVPGPLTYFARDLSDAEQKELAGVAPGVRLVVGLTREQAVERAAEAHGADGSYATPEFLRAATRLAWVQAHSAGVDRYMRIPELVEADRVVLTNMRGVHGPAIADHVFAMLLALTRDLPVHLAGRADGAWGEQGSGVLTPIVLQGRTMLIVGLGGIGTEVARRAQGFGMRVLAVRRGDDPAPPFVERVSKPGQLHEVLPEADVVVLAVPLTKETEGMIGTAEFSRMRHGSYLVNISRGTVVVTDALLEALKSGKLAGACLDVTDPEPLPPMHPLWRYPNVVITPHVAAGGELTEERAWQLLRENLRRFDAGEPLLNVVDKRAGY